MSRFTPLESEPTALPYSRDAQRLLQEGAISLAAVECNGMRVDEEYLGKTISRNERRIRRMEARIGQTEVMRVWRKFYKQPNLESDAQLGDILFDKMGFTPAGKTQGGQYAVDEEALSKIDDSFITDYLQIRKLKKAVNTNLRGILREVVDGKIHCFFNLHTTRTYRSSSDSFNFQNIPVRNQEIANLIRRSFIARRGRRIVEVDLKGAEVRVAACYHKDPRMIEYILDESKDMHRDMAMECFMLPQAEVTKQTRYCGKNMFVFPQFYGDWYKDCARHLWEAMDKLHLETVSGMPMAKHLARKGIRSLGACDSNEDPEPGTFEAHIQRVEREFWRERFPIYAAWKRKWYTQYQERGWFQTLTGFICQGYMRRNEVINYPVQGSAFHCLLWALIRLVREELPRRKMKTLIVGQIHDSIVADVPEEEVQDYVALVHRIIVKELPKEWPWLIVPLDIEAEASPVNGNWAEKTKIV